MNTLVREVKSGGVWGRFIHFSLLGFENLRGCRGGGLGGIKPRRTTSVDVIPFALCLRVSRVWIGGIRSGNFRNGDGDGGGTIVMVTDFV